jgi:VanZ family protein
VRARPILLVVTVIYVSLVALATVTPAWLPRAVFDGLFGIDRGSVTPAAPAADASDVDFVANILMFAPIGLLLVVLLGARRWAVALATAVAFTVLIECVQVGIPSRVADVNDVLLNAGGALLGVVAALVLARARSGLAARAPEGVALDERGRA